MAKIRLWVFLRSMYLSSSPGTEVQVFVLQVSANQELRTAADLIRSCKAATISHLWPLRLLSSFLLPPPHRRAGPCFHMTFLHGDFDHCGSSLPPRLRLLLHPEGVQDLQAPPPLRQAGITLESHDRKLKLPGSRSCTICELELTSIETPPSRQQQQQQPIQLQLLRLHLDPEKPGPSDGFTSSLCSKRRQQSMFCAPRSNHFARRQPAGAAPA